MKKQFLVGVDEAGRGPLAGPVSVGVVFAPKNFDFRKHFPGLNDSKQVSPEKREELYEILLGFAREEKLRFCVRYSNAHAIDTVGITQAVRRAIYRGVRSVAPEPAGVHVLLDGLLHAPQDYSQETIIRGDESQPIISLASIVAKVRRDRLMRRLAKEYPHYDFDIHKGYGTRSHYAAIQKHGLCDIHRRSYCN